MNTDIENSGKLKKGLSNTKKVIFSLIFILGLIAFVYSYGNASILALLEFDLLPMLIIYLYLKDKSKK